MRARKRLSVPDRMAPRPYKVTPIFDSRTLPQALRCEHRTKEGTWGLLRVLEGEVTLIFAEPRREILVTSGQPAVIPPQDTHFVKVEGPMRMQVEFYRQPPIPA